MRPNIIFYFSDQQRADTINETLTPNLTRLASDGVRFDSSFTCQPVCGPARACLQTGVYATRCGAYFNGVPPIRSLRTLASCFSAGGYETAYVGKWHLASDRMPGRGFHCETSAVPIDRRLGYDDYWMAADVLEFTSHGDGGYVFDRDGSKIEFGGYRPDRINDFAMDYIFGNDHDKPFFLFVSQLEPHHQNDRHRFEGPPGCRERFASYPRPRDLETLGGDSKEQFPDYCGAVNALDSDVGRLVDALKEHDMLDDTVIIYTSDHGCHFRTRNLEYKRSCHDASTHTPLIIRGGPFRGGAVYDGLVSLIDLPPTLLELAGIPVPEQFAGRSLLPAAEGKKIRDDVFIQISESETARAVRTAEFLYCARAPVGGMTAHSSPVYFEEHFYDLRRDPYQLHDLAGDRSYVRSRDKMRRLLIKEMVQAGEKPPVILNRH